MSGQQKWCKHVMASSFLVLVVIIAQMAVVAASPFMQPESGIQELVSYWTYFRISFFVALLLAPVMIYFFLSIDRLIDDRPQYRAIAGRVLSVFYLICVTAAYGSQLTLLPHYLNEGNRYLAAAWIFHDTESIAYALGQTGYAALAIVIFLLFISLFQQQPLLRIGAVLFGCGALLFVAAYLLLLLNHGLPVFLTIAGKALFLPAQVFVFLWAFQRYHQDTEHSTGESTSSM